MEDDSGNCRESRKRDQREAKFDTKQELHQEDCASKKSEVYLLDPGLYIKK